MNNIDIVVLNRCANIILLDRITRHGKVIYESNQDARLDFEQKCFTQPLTVNTREKN
jgi:hypothetical protein